MPKTLVQPYLLSKSEDGIRITIRTTRFNSQGYPLVDSRVLTESFPSAAKARSYLRAEYRAEATDITTK